MFTQTIIRIIYIGLLIAIEVLAVVPYSASTMMPRQNMVIYASRQENLSTKRPIDDFNSHFEEVVEAGVTAIHYAPLDGKGGVYSAWEFMNEAREYGMWVGHRTLTKTLLHLECQWIVQTTCLSADYYVVENPYNGDCIGPNVYENWTFDENAYTHIEPRLKRLHPGASLYIMDGSNCYNTYKNWSKLNGMVKYIWDETAYNMYMPQIQDWKSRHSGGFAAGYIWGRVKTADNTAIFDDNLFSKWFTDSYNKFGNVMIYNLTARVNAKLETRLAQIKAVTGGTPIPQWQNFTQSGKAGAPDCEVQVKSAAGLDPASIECYYANAANAAKWIRHYGVTASGETGVTDWVTIKATRVPFITVDPGEPYSGNRIRFKITDRYSSDRVRNYRQFKRNYGVEIEETVWSNFSGTYGAAALTSGYSVKVQSSEGLTVGTPVCEYSDDGGTSWKSCLAACSGTDGSTEEETITTGAVTFTKDRSLLNKIRFSLTTKSGNILQSPEYDITINTPPVIANPVVTKGTGTVDLLVSIRDNSGLRIGKEDASLKEQTISLLNMEDKGKDISGRKNHAYLRHTASVQPVASWKASGEDENAMYFKKGELYEDQWQVADFRGSWDYADMGQFPLGKDSTLSITAWIYPKNLGTVIMSMGGPHERGRLRILTSTEGALVVNHNNMDKVKNIDISTPDGKVRTNKWYHIALSVDENSARLYLDGQLTAEDTSSWADFSLLEFRGLWLGKDYGGYNSGDSESRWVVGMRTQYSSYDGYMDEVHLINRALSDYEIASEFYSGQYRYTTDGGQTWSEWEQGTIDIADGSKEQGTMTISGIPVTPANDSSVRVEITARDVNGNTALRQLILQESGVVVPIEKAKLFTGKVNIAPNPFYDKTGLIFTLKSSQKVDISIYNMAAAKVHNLSSGVKNAGTHTVGWDGKDEHNNELSAGQYFARVQVGAKVVVRKLLKLK
ncbi:MAG: T9SS type A sorting domain-containing protein [Fibrobacteria bacterium]|nr:T9SS type A sorting domain-containing protein [Fibrobacteria bacterium]